MGDVIPEPGSNTRRAGFDGALWEFRHAIQPGDLWGSGSNVTLLKNVGAKQVGWVRTAFSPLRPDNTNDAGKAAVWWRFLPAAGQTRANGTNIVEGTQCVQDFGRDADTNPGGGTGPMDGYSGDFVPDTSSGWMVASYFAGQTDYQMFMYFENLTPGSTSPTDQLSVPRWINATRFNSIEPTHTCANHSYEDPAPFPGTGSARLCMFESKGYGADGSDPLPGGWDPVRDQTWRGSFFRAFPTTSTASFRIVSPEPGQSAPPLTVVDASLTSAGGAVAHKLTNLHEIRAAQVNAAGQLQPPSNAAQSCPVQISGVAQGLCDLRLHWITNGFPVAAVYMKYSTGERVLVRDSSPITPLDGYPYPARGGAAGTQVPGGVGPGESVEFELYKDRNRTELLAKSATVTGVPQTGSCGASAVQPTMVSPINGGTVSAFRPTFTFTLTGAASRYRIRLYDGATFLAQYDAPAPVTGTQAVELPSYVSAVLTDPTRVYTWKVQQITACGVSSAAINTFRIDAPPIKDAAAGPIAPSYASDSAPLVGEVPLSPSVDGGAAAMSIPIEVAPGRHGMQPALSLDYSSRGGNSLAGMGWSLSGVSSIHRCPATPAQDNGVSAAVRMDGSDKLCLDGQRLMRMNTVGYGLDGAWYRTEIDSGVRVRQIGNLDSLSVRFEADLKSGETQYFGTNTQSRNIVKVPSTSGSTPVDAVMSWSLERRKDAAGNTVDFTYATFGSGELLLTQVNYTGHVKNGTFTPGDRAVVINYQGAGVRPSDSGANDKSSAFVAGARIDQTRRIASIVTKAGASTAKQVRSYTMQYDAPSAHTGRSLLRAVKVCGTSDTQCLPRAVFGWQESPPQFQFKRAQGLPATQPQVLGRGRDGHIMTFDRMARMPLDPIDGVPGKIGSLRPLGDLDGDGVVDYLAAVSSMAGETPVYSSYLLKLKADRTTGPSYLVPPDWASDYTLYGEDIDLNNDGRSEIWGMKVQQTATGATGVGTYPFYSKLRVHGWKPGTTSGWESGNFESIELPIIVASGRLVLRDTGGDRLGSDIYGTDFVRFADVNGDLKPDLVIQRTPYGATDPIVTSTDPNVVHCSNDGLGVPGDLLIVYLNTSPDSTLANLQFGGSSTNPAAAYSECLDSEPTMRRNNYANLSDVKDLNGDGVPDFRFKKKSGGPAGKIEFGTRTGTTASWPSNLRSDEQGLSPDSRSDETREQWLDVNGDGLDDLYSASNCTNGGNTASLIEFIRLGTARSTSSMAGNSDKSILTKRIRLDGATTDATGCTVPSPLRGNAFAVAADIDSDGRSELLRAASFASRVCTELPGKNREGSPEWAWYCPGNPQGEPMVPTEVFGQTAHDMYNVPDYGGGAPIDPSVPPKFDDSVYHMDAFRFVYLGPDASGKPAYRLDNAGDSGIVLNPGTKSQTADLYGDGLMDAFGNISGCRVSSNCVALNASTKTEPLRPPCQRCTWGPSEWPDGTAIDIGQSFFYLSENIGVGNDPSVGAQPMLPDMVRSARTLRDGDTNESFANETIWRYAPLSSNGGRSGNNLPLYTIPARATAPNGAPTGYIDAEHFYFASSMPVVALLEQTTASAFGRHYVQYGYQEAMYNNRGRGFTGFRKIIEEDLDSGRRTTRRFQQKFPLVSRIDCEAVSLVGEAEDCPMSGTQLPIVRTTNTWLPVDCGSGTCASDRFVSVRLSRTVTQERDLAPLPRSSLKSQTITNIQYDNYENVTWRDQLIIDAVPVGTTVESTVMKLRDDLFTYAAPVVDGSTWWVDKLVSKSHTTNTTYQTGHLPRSGAALPTLNTENMEVYGWDATTRQINCTAVLKATPATPLPTTCADAQTRPQWERTATTTFDSIGYGNPASIITLARDPLGTVSRTTTSDYSASGGYFANTITTLGAVGQSLTTTTAFDDRWGVPTSATDPRGLVTTSAYDALGRQTEVVAPMSGSVRMAPPKWTIRKWCVPSAQCMGIELFHVIEQQPGSPTAFTYFDVAGNAVRVDRESYSGSLVRTQKIYNQRNLLVMEVAPAIAPQYGAITYYYYDQLDRVIRKDTEVNDVSTGVPVANGTKRRTTYTYAGFRTDIDVCPKLNSATGACDATIPPRLTMSRTVDSDGNMLRTVDAQSNWTSYFLDADNNIRAIEDAKNAMTTAVYDGLNRRTSSVDPSRGSSTYTYDGFGQLRTQVDGRSLTSTYQYDPIGRKTQRYWREPDGENVATGRCMMDTWTYDDSRGGLLTSEKRERVSAIPGETNCPTPSVEKYERTFDYSDPLKRMAGNTTSITVGPIGTATKAFTRYVRYDTYFGRVKQEVYPEGVSVYREYNARGYAYRSGFSEDFLDYGDARNKWLTQVVSMTERDQVSELQFFNNTHRRLTRYDASRGLPLEICVQVDGSACSKATDSVQTTLSNKVVDVAYRYDAYDNVTRQTQYGARSPFPGGNNPGQVPFYEDFGYDSLMRLTQAQVSFRIDGSANVPVSYGYDAIGNFTTKSDYSVSGGYVYGNAAKPHQVTRVNMFSNQFADFTYDGNGNLSRRTAYSNVPELRVYSDIDNLPLATFTDPSGAANGLRFRYGPDLQRYYQELKTSFTGGDGASQTYYVDKSYEREDFGGNVTEHRYYLGDGVFVIRDNRASGSKAGTYFSHGDRLGSSVATTGTNGALAVLDPFNPVELRMYDAFGKVRSDWGTVRPSGLGDTNPRGFTQHEHLDKVGLIHMNGRAYDPNLGRFLGVDPVIQFPTNSQSLNPYSYIMNNPLAGADPTGYMSSICDHPGTAGGSNSCFQGKTDTQMQRQMNETLARGTQRALTRMRERRSNGATGGTGLTGGGGLREQQAPASQKGQPARLRNFDGLLQSHVGDDGLEVADTAEEAATFARENRQDFEEAMVAVGVAYPELKSNLRLSSSTIDTGGEAGAKWTDDGIALDEAIVSGSVRLPYLNALVLAAHEALHPLVFQYEGGRYSYYWSEFWSETSPTPNYGYPHYWIDERSTKAGVWINQGERYQRMFPRPDISKENYLRCTNDHEC